MSYECVMKCGNPCNVTDTISQVRWDSLKSKTEKWSGLDKFGDVYSSTSWDTGPSGYYMHQSCYITISSSDNLTKVQQRKKRESDKLKSDTAQSSVCNEEEMGPAAPKCLRSALGPLHDKTKCVWCMKDKDPKHPKRVRGKLFRLSTHSSWHAFKRHTVLIEDVEMRERLTKLVESTQALSDPFGSFAKNIMYHPGCWRTHISHKNFDKENIMHLQDVSLSEARNLFFQYVDSAIFTEHEIRSLQSLLTDYKRIVGDYGYAVGDMKSSYLKDLLIDEYKEKIGFKERSEMNKSEWVYDVGAGGDNLVPRLPKLTKDTPTVMPTASTSQVATFFQNTQQEPMDTSHEKSGYFFRKHQQPNYVQPDDDHEGTKSTNEELAYIPPVRYIKERAKKPDRIQLPEGVSRKSLLRSTTAAATRWGLSSAAHLGMVASTVNAAGGNMKEVVASLPTVKRHRKSAQEEIANAVKSNFISQFKDQKKVLHWDGKITQFLDVQGLVYQDCNAVVLSVPLSGVKPQFIGAPVVRHGTGQLLAQSALHCLDEWQARDDIIATVFDTTSSNTSIHQGAAVKIEEQIEPNGRALLWLACRHHIAELHIKHPYDKVQGPTKGPDDPLFKRFKGWFTTQAQEARANGQIFPDPRLFAKWQWGDDSPMGPYQSDTSWWERATLTWVQEQLHADTFPRGDYRELCELINIILGGEPIRMRRGEVFQHFEMYSPGAYHHARFMGKSLYLLKIYLLHNTFPLTQHQQNKIARLVGFVVQLYGRYFLSAPLSVAAPRHDLGLWYDLISFRQHDPQIAQAALASVRRHLWYLCPELVVFSLFDDFNTLDEKQLIAVTLLNTPRPNVFSTGKPGQPKFNPVAAHLTDEKPSLSAFVNERSWLLFHQLGSQAEWLSDDPAIWPDSEDFMACKRFCEDLQVVNDPAERAVKDVSDCAQMTRDPRHRDSIIILRSDHRGRVPNLRKANLNQV